MTLTTEPTPAALAERASGRRGEPRIRARGLSVGFATPSGERRVVSDVSFELHAGRCLAIVGESGSGKSVTARTLVGLTGRGAVVEAEELSLDGEDLRGFRERRWRGIRGRRIGVVLQDALVSLDPLRPVGAEIAEALRLHGWGDRRARRARVVDLLEAVGVPEPERRARQRPGELSGGLRQRALIASAIALEPEIVIADEPTTALDVSVQAQVLAQLAAMKQRGVSLVLISHDLSVVAHLADDILVMRAGEVVEQGEAARVLGDPQHPYTRDLIAAVPGGHTRDTRLAPHFELPAFPARHRPPHDDASPLVEAVGLRKSYPVPGGGRSTAVGGVSFTIEHGRTVGIVGESGSGKSTTARLVLALEQPDAGEVRIAGKPWSGIRESRRRPGRRRVSVVAQDPLSSFDPRWTVEQILRDALGTAQRPAARDARIRELLRLVALPDAVLGRSPLTLSGGQRQRVAIARALAGEPELIVLDEAVSALDVSVQAQILDLLVALQDALGVSYLFISHDLGVIHHMSDDILVMKDGLVVEHGDPDAIFHRPQHPYTRDLVGALARLDAPAPAQTPSTGDPA
ncbi:ABC transporter ATP-binding protein [Protaetiibacter sp. SSC-01]|uniref:dipeptide ABC transporter ATP-binding protein n=1 Tax=Protaetiibacter sp. SSC-01 TaxID=2759943 RepID=UPI001CA41D06|nr:ABC transporter ATP-binding protein [Protaetiibacter sp. SSC-01]